jgi:phospholipid/cholesterol/gamma-HCH transport system substrate-binding protein
LQSGARVEVAGVEIGRVESVALTDTLTKARATLSIQPDIRLPQDSRAAIRTAGLIGERFIDIEIGPAAETISPGGRIQHTESATDILDTVGQALFGNLNATGQVDSATAGDVFDLGLD